MNSIKVIALLAAVAFAVGADILDVTTTEQAIKKGAVESNTFLVGSKPTALALYLRDSLMILLSSGFTILAIAVPTINVGWVWGGLAGPVVLGIKHILGYHTGKAWLAANNK